MNPVICADSAHDAGFEVAFDAMQWVVHYNEVLAGKEGDLPNQGVRIAEYSYFVAHRKGDAPDQAIGA